MNKSSEEIYYTLKILELEWLFTEDPEIKKQILNVIQDYKNKNAHLTLLNKR